MAKKDKKQSKKDKTPAPSDVVDAVRGAVERTFQATTGGTDGARDRGRTLLDDVASAAQRIRESFDDLRVLEDVRGLRAEVDALSRRVAELEKTQGATTARVPRAAARTGTGTRSTRSSAATTRSPRSSAATTRTPRAGSGSGKTAAAARKPTAAPTAAAKTTPKATPAKSAPTKAAASRRKSAAPRTPSGS